MKNLTKKQKANFLTAKGELRKIITDKFMSYTGEFQQITRTGYYSGYGRFTKSASFEKDFTDFLDVMKIKYTVGNDAPKGGVLGDFVKISSRAVAKLNRIVSELR